MNRSLYTVSFEVLVYAFSFREDYWGVTAVTCDIFTCRLSDQNATLLQSALFPEAAFLVFFPELQVVTLAKIQVWSFIWAIFVITVDVTRYMLIA